MWNTKANIKQCQIRNACFQMFYYFHYSACYLFTTFFSAYLDYIKPLICWSFSRIWVIACTRCLKQVFFLLKLYILTGRKLEKVIVLPNMKIIYNSFAPLSSTTSGIFFYELRKSYLEEILKCMVIPLVRSEEATESFCDIIPELCC